jgi:hypothetical protein
MLLIVPEESIQGDDDGNPFKTENLLSHVAQEAMTDLPARQ